MFWELSPTAGITVVASTPASRKLIETLKDIPTSGKWFQYQ